MAPVSPKNVRITDPFWSYWQNLLMEVTLPHEYKMLEETPRLQNFRNVIAGEGKQVGRYFDDSDVYKWIEACAWALLACPDHSNAGQVRQLMDQTVDLVIAAQEPSGYINTFFQLNHPTRKWSNLHAMHEMYCAGHLIEAAVVHHNATGDRKFLDCGIRLADHIYDLFGPGKRVGYCGHQEIELALVALSQSTGDRKYRELAKHMIDQRGTEPRIFAQEIADKEVTAISPWSERMWFTDGKYTGEYTQDHAPIREHKVVVGHAVRAMYFYAAATEVCDELAPGIEEALNRCWSNLVGKRMYITGGIGPAHENEGFTRDFDLPNLTAYAETCAAIGLVMWGRRMLERTGHSEYADVIERALYNGILSGISLSGDKFFYDNPLESRGTHERVPWFSCACCPPNVARLFGSLSQYVLGVGDHDVWLHLPVGLEASFKVGGSSVSLSVSGEYPARGGLKVRVGCAAPVAFALRIRIPDWCDDLAAEMDSDEEGVYEDGYVVFDRTWKDGDTVTLDFEMPATWMASNPAILDNLGHVALVRGPILYALEEADFGMPPQRFIADVEADIVESEPPRPLKRGEGAGGEGSRTLPNLTVPGWAEASDFPDAPYAPEAEAVADEVSATFVPYFTWANRGPGHMAVWVRRG